MTLTKYDEGRIIRLGVVFFWTVFWLLNVIDKLISKSTFLWVGKDRLTQFIKYFASIGIENENVALAFLVFVTLAQITALYFLASSLWYSVKKREQKAYDFFFWGTLMGLAIFSFFSIGDQIFGDRAELLEHTLFWIAIIISWGAYKYFPQKASN